MIGIIGHIEVDNAFIFAVIEFEISQFQAVVFNVVIRLYRSLSVETQFSWGAIIAVNDRETDSRSLLPVYRIEGAGTHKDAQHVVDAVAITMFHPRV